MELVLDDLACRRGGRLVFRGVSFRLPAGSVAELRGPNGAGKSSLIRLLAGLLPPAGGDARLGGRSLRTEPVAFHDQVALVGHLDAVKPALTVTENLHGWAGILGAPPGRAEAALARFGLGPAAGRPAGACSAGQKRRLGLARLMLADRPLWLLDEPTVSLDREGTGLISRLVAEHCGAGGSALIATHSDLGLGAVPVLTLTPLAVIPAEADDPFLAGAWA